MLSASRRQSLLQLFQSRHGGTGSTLPIPRPRLFTLNKPASPACIVPIHFWIHFALLPLILPRGIPAAINDILPNPECNLTVNNFSQIFLAFIYLLTLNRTRWQKTQK